MNVAVVGLGYVGFTLSIYLSSIGLKIYGFDKNDQLVNQLNQNKPQISEKGINDKFKSVLNKKLFIYKNKQINQLGIKFDYIFICVGTPLKNKKPNLIYFQNCLKFSLKHIKSSGTIILRCTLPIGTTENSYNKLNKHYPLIDLAYCPERTIEGNAIQELSNLPQIISSSKNKFSKLEILFRKAKIYTLRAQTTKQAEAVKLFCNTYRDLNFSISNIFAEICQRFEISAFETINLSNKRYIRGNIPKHGLVSGPCLSKDPIILSYGMSKPYKDLIQTGRKLTKIRINTLIKMTYDKLNVAKKNNLVISGLAFKGFPITNDLRDSHSFLFLKMLRKKLKNTDIFIHDFAIKKEILKESFNQFSLFDYKRKYDGVIFLNNHKLYKNNKKKIFSYFNLKNNSFILDTWKI